MEKQNKTKNAVAEEKQAQLRRMISVKSSLSTSQLLILQSEFEKSKKSVGVGYLLLILTGVFGGHEFYVGRMNRGILYIVLLATSILIIPGIVLGVFLLIDLFMLPSQIKEANEGVEFEKIIALFPSVYERSSKDVAESSTVLPEKSN